MGGVRAKSARWNSGVLPKTCSERPGRHPRPTLVVLCHRFSEAVPRDQGDRPGFRGAPIGSPLRTFQNEHGYLLHHRCPSSAVADHVADDQWYFCDDPDRPIDQRTVFDRNCEQCEAAWVATGRGLWNGLSPNPN